jgi:hypothetical protein
VKILHQGGVQCQHVFFGAASIVYSNCRHAPPAKKTCSMFVSSFRHMYIRRLILTFCICTGSYVSGQADDAYSSAAFPLSLPAKVQYQSGTVVHADLYSALHFNNSSPRKEPHKPGIIIGSVMFFSGGILYAVGHVLADNAYDEYQRSAFTGSTDRLRRQIQIYNVMRFGGGALGGLGLIAVLVSF